MKTVKEPTDLIARYQKLDDTRKAYLSGFMDGMADQKERDEAEKAAGDEDPAEEAANQTLAAAI